MRILVAEDETIIRLDLRALLEAAGHEVVAEARDGEEAVALARSHAPDLAIMDVKMPRLDGIEAARRILDERPIPIVMLTAYGQRELVARAVEAGVFGYLVKPFREQDLVPALATAQARHEELLAVLDVRMPRLDGIEAAKRILAERPIPIVMLTAYGQDELVSRAVEAGVFGYLVKPFREQDLVPAIATARARHEELAAVREEAESLADALAARKAIERAKGLLMEKEGLSEGDAFARLRKASQVSGRPLRVIAEAVIDTLDPS